MTQLAPELLTATKRRPFGPPAEELLARLS
jgi:hypothetical protein